MKGTPDALVKELQIQLAEEKKNVAEEIKKKEVIILSYFKLLRP